MTADRCIALGAHWCCLRTRSGSEGDAHQPLVIISFSEYSWARSGGCVQHVIWLQENEKLCPSFSHRSRLLSYGCSSAWELVSFCKGFHGGRVIGTIRVPMGMANLPAAPERWCTSAISFPCLTTARLSHDMTHSFLGFLKSQSQHFNLSLCFYVLFFFFLWSCYWVAELYQPCLPAGEIKNLQRWV